MAAAHDPLVVALAVAKACNGGLTPDDCKKLSLADALEVQRQIITLSREIRTGGHAR